MMKKLNVMNRFAACSDNLWRLKMFRSHKVCTSGTDSAQFVLHLGITRTTVSQAQHKTRTQFQQAESSSSLHYAAVALWKAAHLEA